MKRLEKRFGTLSGWGAAAVAILVWGVTFAHTRILLEDFSALEINLIRFGLAWLVLWLRSTKTAWTSTIQTTVVWLNIV